MSEDFQDASAHTAAQQQKFLRYRSVRRSAANNNPEAQTPPPLPETSQTSLTRLPSRYHRRPPTSQSAPPTPPFPQHVRQNNGHATQSRMRGKTVGAVRDDAQDVRLDNNPRRTLVQHTDARPGTRQTTSKTNSRKQTLTSTDETSETYGLRRSYEAAREEARLILEGEHDRLKALKRQEEKRLHEERERRRLIEEEAQKEALRLQADAVVAREAEEVVKAEPKASNARGRTKLFRHAEVRSDARNTAAQPPGRTHVDGTRSKMRTLVIGGPSKSVQEKEKHHRRTSSAVEQVRLKPSSSHVRNNSADRINEVGGVGSTKLKNFDAPVSAVNAGERRVGVKCKDAYITLPVTPSTTVKEILNSASLCMSAPIDPRTAVLLESFSQMGLERPLRRYERIRDVMNSWDNDNQHHLQIFAAGECAVVGLQITDAPQIQPLGTTVHIYHSQKPGKWDKRWVTLREDGQITVSKNENGTDSTNICHVSDSDLYTPTARQIKKLRPPKKICYAFKSQEKSAMFLDGSNFVNFFCTKDKDGADRWYHAVHSWRSWYLVNMLGEGHKPLLEPAAGQADPRPGASNSTETVPSVMGSFKPLIDFGSGFAPRRPSQLGGQRPLIDLVPGRPSMDEKRGSPEFAAKSQEAAPPSAFPTRFMIDPNTKRDADGAFTGAGLLGRSASRRTQGGARTGRGIPCEDGKPLVDLAPTSEFTDGSLLRKMEAKAGRQGTLEPTIDRQKRREVEIAVGEGF